MRIFSGGLHRYKGSRYSPNGYRFRKIYTFRWVIMVQKGCETRRYSLRAFSSVILGSGGTFSYSTFIWSGNGQFFLVKILASPGLLAVFEFSVSPVAVFCLMIFALGGGAQYQMFFMTSSFSNKGVSVGIHTLY